MSKNKKQPIAIPSHKNKLLIAGVLVVALVLIAAAWFIPKLLTTDDAKAPAATASTAPPSPSSPTSAPATPGSSAVGGSEEANRKEVLAQAVALLRTANKVGKEGKSYEATLTSIQGGDFSALPKSFQEEFRFSDYFSDKELQAASYIAVIHLSQLMERVATAQGNEEIETLTATAWKNVYVDMEAGQAFVPVTVFLGQDASFSLEYAYVGGEWKLTPYSLIDAIQAAERASASASADS